MDYAKVVAAREAKKNQNIKGKIILNLVKGIALVPQDGNTSDSKVYITISGCKGDMESKTIDKNLNPEWNQKFEKAINIKRGGCKPIRFHVLDNDFTGDDNMGYIYVDMDPLFDNPGKWA